MGIEHLTFDEAYWIGGGYGGYTNVLSTHDLLNAEGSGTGTVQRFLSKGFDPTGLNVLVLGAGPGWLVKNLRETWNMLAWGMESSTWPLANDQSGGYLIAGDATSAADLDNAALVAGVNKWDCIISEQLVTSWNDTTIESAVALWRDRSTKRAQLDWSGVLHLVHTHLILEPAPHLGNTDNDPYGPRDEPYRQRTLAEWQTFFDGTLGGGDRPDWVWRWVDGAEVD